MTKLEAKNEATRLFNIGKGDENIEKIEAYITKKTGKDSFDWKCEQMDISKEEYEYQYNIMTIEALEN